MADVLSRSDLFVPSGRSSIPLPRKKRVSSVGFRRFSLPSKPVRSSSNSDFHGRKLVIEERRWKPMKGTLHAVPLPIQMSLRFAKTVKWWEKGIQPNMKEITSAQDLVVSLLNAGNKLVVVDFFSPGCGGCKALHPKICQFAEMNPDVQFLQVNYEEHKSMSYSLNVHVLPFFRFYRGAHGRLCSFSCTNATVKKFREAIAKHSTDRCSLGPTKGLEESELMALAANRDLGFNYTPREPAIAMEAEDVPERLPATPMVETARRKSEEKTLVAAWR